MLRKIGKLFVIKTKWEAYIIIYALALGCTARGSQYLIEYPGWFGKLMFLATTGAVFLAGAKIFDALAYERKAREAEAAQTSSHKT
ncbi:hypothetical protein [Pontixanthobacter sp. CEM42]|uniref:hypothetical protein n=1 Tax=Pontixanthobacter sp. CEM42 TaxID=2792077 RepID=UPI001AE0C151|nr:hypothetical protein [Pontixanthobacter sp. CEM42]